jgi:predicted nucleotidyltransferase component of viral defense system
MEDLAAHERFEIEVLQYLHDRKLLDLMVFGGGTALRLCYGLPRYSVDLDFWAIKADQTFFQKMKTVLGAKYQLTGSASKYYSYLFELRGAGYLHKLKIEIRKELPKKAVYEWAIAFTMHATSQVKLKTFTLASLFGMKKHALIERKEIRDAYDLEFLLRKTAKPEWEKGEKEKIRQALEGFKAVDFKVKLGALLSKDQRRFYSGQRFTWLESQLTD